MALSILEACQHGNLHTVQAALAEHASKRGIAAKALILLRSFTASIPEHLKAALKRQDLDIINAVLTDDEVQSFLADKDNLGVLFTFCSQNLVGNISEIIKSLLCCHLYLDLIKQHQPLFHEIGIYINDPPKGIDPRFPAVLSTEEFLDYNHCYQSAMSEIPKKSLRWALLRGDLEILKKYQKLEERFGKEVCPEGQGFLRREKVFSRDQLAACAPLADVSSSPAPLKIVRPDLWEYLLHEETNSNLLLEVCQIFSFCNMSIDQEIGIMVLKKLRTHRQFMGQYLLDFMPGLPSGYDDTTNKRFFTLLEWAIYARDEETLKEIVKEANQRYADKKINNIYFRYFDYTMVNQLYAPFEFCADKWIEGATILLDVHENLIDIKLSQAIQSKNCRLVQRVLARSEYNIYESEVTENGFEMFVYHSRLNGLYGYFRPADQMVLLKTALQHQRYEVVRFLLNEKGVIPRFTEAENIKVHQKGWDQEVLNRHLIAILRYAAFQNAHSLLTHLFKAKHITTLDFLPDDLRETLRSFDNIGAIDCGDIFKTLNESGTCSNDSAEDSADVLNEWDDIIKVVFIQKPELLKSLEQLEKQALAAHVKFWLLQACYQGNLEVVQALLAVYKENASQDPLRRTLLYGFTPLFIATLKCLASKEATEKDQYAQIIKFLIRDKMNRSSRGEKKVTYLTAVEELDPLRWKELSYRTLLLTIIETLKKEEFSLSTPKRSFLDVPTLINIARQQIFLPAPTLPDHSKDSNMTSIASSGSEADFPDGEETQTPEVSPPSPKFLPGKTKKIKSRLNKKFVSDDMPFDESECEVVIAVPAKGKKQKPCKTPFLSDQLPFTENETLFKVRRILPATTVAPLVDPHKEILLAKSEFVLYENIFKFKGPREALPSKMTLCDPIDDSVEYGPDPFLPLTYFKLERLQGPFIPPEMTLSALIDDPVVYGPAPLLPLIYNDWNIFESTHKTFRSVVLNFPTETEKQDNKPLSDLDTLNDDEWSDSDVSDSDSEWSDTDEENENDTPSTQVLQPQKEEDWSFDEDTDEEDYDDRISIWSCEREEDEENKLNIKPKIAPAPLGVKNIEKKKKPEKKLEKKLEKKPQNKKVEKENSRPIPFPKMQSKEMIDIGVSDEDIYCDIEEKIEAYSCEKNKQNICENLEYISFLSEAKRCWKIDRNQAKEGYCKYLVSYYTKVSLKYRQEIFDSKNPIKKDGKIRILDGLHDTLNPPLRICRDYEFQHRISAFNKKINDDMNTIKEPRFFDIKIWFYQFVRDLSPRLCERLELVEKKTNGEKFIADLKLPPDPHQLPFRFKQ